MYFYPSVYKFLFTLGQLSSQHFSARNFDYGTVLLIMHVYMSKRTANHALAMSQSRGHPVSPTLTGVAT